MKGPLIRSGEPCKTAETCYALDLCKSSFPKDRDNLLNSLCAAPTAGQHQELLIVGACACVPT